MTPWAEACQGPLSMEFSRQEYWSGLLFPFPGCLSHAGIDPKSPALAGRFFTTEPPGKPLNSFLRWNSNNKQFTLFKYTVWWLLICSELCVNFRTLPLLPKGSLHPLAVTLHFPSLHPRQPLIYFFLVFVDLPVLHISHTWNKILCGLWGLASFTEHHGFKTWSCCRVCQCFISFHWRIIKLF